LDQKVYRDAMYLQARPVRQAVEVAQISEALSKKSIDKTSQDSPWGSRIMATYKGRSVTLNKPRRIAKGETSYGKKKSVVYVTDGDKTKRVTFGDPDMTIKKAQKGRRS
jgi:hypothetical protein